jgi:hypothetical protein
VLCFELLVNGRAITRAGSPTASLLYVGLAWHPALDGEQRQGDPLVLVDVGAADTSDADEERSLGWLDDYRVGVGDEVTVRILDSASADPPRSLEVRPVRISRQPTTGGSEQLCSFCGRRRTQKISMPGIGGVGVFVCHRCLVLADQLFESGSSAILHISHSSRGECSFCGQESSALACARDSAICPQCVRSVGLR